MTSEPTTPTARKVVAVYGDRLLDDVLGIEAEARAIGAVEGTEGLRAMLRENRDLTAYVSRHAASRNHDWSSACDGCNPDPEARAAAERDVAALVEVVRRMTVARDFLTLHSNNVIGGQVVQASKVLALLEEALEPLANPAAAEPKP